ncbi:MAG: phosphatidate cytidylyltransferase [Clostridiales bacterium]|nr:phosphatidate cytidylyltransferase [Clostridiales bacterium]
MLKKLLTKSFWIRVLSSVPLVVITLVTILLGGNLLFVVSILLSLIGMFELYRIIKIQDKLPGFMGYVSCILYYGLMIMGYDSYFMIFIIVYLMSLMAIYVFKFPKYKLEDLIMVFFGLVYVGVMFSYIYRIRILNDGFYLVWLVFISSWISDTCAYLFGVTFGSHKLAPVLSPNKSIEGSISGVIGSALIGGLYGMIFKNSITAFISPIIGCAIVCGVGSIISQIGDLTASAIKRNYKAKDYGKLIPGHGGILDRFDSLIFVAPAIYFLCLLVY